MNLRPAPVEAGADAGSPNSAVAAKRAGAAGTAGGQTCQPARNQQIDEQHIDNVAQALCSLLGVQARPRLARRLRDWPQIREEAEDICQLAALAFMEAWRQGRIAPDSQSGEYTARSVAAYAWGICNRIFSGVVRSRRPLSVGLDQVGGEPAAPQDTGALYELLGGGPGDADSRLWDVLNCAGSRCRPEDIIVTYLLASGVTVGEVRQLLHLSANTPANALKRVAHELHCVLGIDDYEGASK